LSFSIKRKSMHYIMPSFRVPLHMAEDDEFASKAKETILLALTRYLAAHAPTSREMPHTAQIVRRLHRGEKLFEEYEK
jgi:hypothetical protein